MTVTADAPALDRSVAQDADEAAGPDVAHGDSRQPQGPVPDSLRPWEDPQPRLGWLVLAIVTTVAAFTRLWALGWPPGKSFDEIYYANESQELLRFGYEDNRGYMFIVHPPLGKWLIAIPQALLGHTEFGWRLAPALAGIASVVLLTRIARRMFRSNVFGGMAGLLLALDGVSVVQSRVALLDIFLQLFVLAGFGALVLDRDQLRGRLAMLLADGADLRDGVPALGPRPWRLVGGVMLGASCAVKWSALSFFVAFAVLSLVWDRGAVKAAGAQRPWRTAARRSWPGALGSLLLAPVATYALSWLGWFAGENSWGRHWADAHPKTTATLNLPLGLHLPFNWGFLPASVRSLGAYHLDAYRFHESLTTPHAYGSKPWSWLVLGRPVEYYYAGDGVTGCGAASCSREILLIGTPLMWWAFAPVLLWLAWHWLTTRDWRAAAVWVAFAAGWLVWLQNTDRTMFLFYMTPLVPFLVLGVTLAAGVLLGPAVGREGTDRIGFAAAVRRRRWGAAAVALYLGLVVVDFAWMWPLFTGGLTTYEQWHLHMWFPSWV